MFKTDTVTWNIVSKSAGWPPCAPPAGEGLCGVVEYPDGYGYGVDDFVTLVSLRYG